MPVHVSRRIPDNHERRSDDCWWLSQRRLQCVETQKKHNLLALKADGDRAKAKEILDRTLLNRAAYMVQGELEMDLAIMSETYAEAHDN